MRLNHLGAGFLAGSAGLAMGFVSPAHAGLTDAFTFRNIAYTQTSGVAPTIPTGFFFSAGANTAAAGDFDGASLTYPGPGSPLTLPLVSPTEFLAQPGFPTKAAMDAAFPFGSYVITATNSVTMTSQTATLSYTADAYTADIPALTAASFAALQGLDTTKPLTVQFNSFTSNPLATDAFTFFSVFGSSAGCGFLSPSSTSCTIAADALMPATTYDFELDFDDRIQAVVGGVLQGVNFDVRTDGSFTTAALPVPEPGGLLVLAGGLLGLTLMRGRKA